MNTVIFWFRNDLRLHDQPALAAALASGATHLLPVVCLPRADEATPWGFARVGTHRRAFAAAALRDLGTRMAGQGNPLMVCHAPPATVLPALAHAVGASAVVCEDIAAPLSRSKSPPCAPPGCRCALCGTAACSSLRTCPGLRQSFPACSPRFVRRWSVRASCPQRLCPRPHRCCRPRWCRPM